MTTDDQQSGKRHDSASHKICEETVLVLHVCWPEQMGRGCIRINHVEHTTDRQAIELSLIAAADVMDPIKVD